MSRVLLATGAVVAMILAASADACIKTNPDPTPWVWWGSAKTTSPLGSSFVRQSIYFGCGVFGNENGSGCALGFAINAPDASSWLGLGLLQAPTVDVVQWNYQNDTPWSGMPGGSLGGGLFGAMTFNAAATQAFQNWGPGNAAIGEPVTWFGFSGFVGGFPPVPVGGWAVCISFDIHKSLDKKLKQGIWKGCVAGGKAMQDANGDFVPVFNDPEHPVELIGCALIPGPAAWPMLIGAALVGGRRRRTA